MIRRFSQPFFRRYVPHSKGLSPGVLVGIRNQSTISVPVSPPTKIFDNEPATAFHAGYRPYFSRILARDVMAVAETTPCVTLLHTQTVYDAAKAMQDNNVASVVVLSDNKRVVGIITERDIILRALAREKVPLETNIGEIMTRDPSCVEPEETMGDCLRFMLENRARHVPVVDFSEEDQFDLTPPKKIHLVGIVSVTDIVRKLQEIDKRELGAIVHQPVKDLMESGDIRVNRLAVRPTDLEIDVIRHLNKYNVGAVLVREGETLLGIVTEKDLVHNIQDPHEATVKSLMSTELDVVTEDYSVQECLALMADKGFRHLPIFDSKNTCLGVLSVRDFLKCVSE